MSNSNEVRCRYCGRPIDLSTFTEEKRAILEKIAGRIDLPLICTDCGQDENKLAEVGRQLGGLRANLELFAAFHRTIDAQDNEGER